MVGLLGLVLSPIGQKYAGLPEAPANPFLNVWLLEATGYSVEGRQPWTQNPPKPHLLSDRARRPIVLDFYDYT